MENNSGEEVFFADWRTRKQGRPQNGLVRTKAFADSFFPGGLEKLDRQKPPIVSVVGSKGKGTASTFCAALLAAEGLQVGSVQSPGYLSNRERIRINGKAISRRDYGLVIAQLEKALRDAKEFLPDTGYIAPGALFTLAAWRYFQDMGCEAWVCEASMGGRRDAISLLSPAVVAVTSIFEEHLGILGNSVAEIADEKLAVITPSTQYALSAPQPFEAVNVLLKAKAGERLVITSTERPTWAGKQWPRGLSRVNATLGATAAQSLLACSFPQRHQRGESAWSKVADTVSLPGRLSVHRLGEQTWVVDCAISAYGISAALDVVQRMYGEGKPDSILLCLADDKNLEACHQVLARQRVLPVKANAPHLHFEKSPDALLLDEIDVQTLGEVVLVLGSIYFAGEVLSMLGVNTEKSFGKVE